MENYICVTCGAQYSATDKPPAECRICQDERQYVGWDGQQWTTLEGMWKGDYKNTIREVEPNQSILQTPTENGLCAPTVP